MNCLKLASFTLAACLIASSCGKEKSKENADETKIVCNNITFESYTYDFIAANTDTVEMDFPGSRYTNYSGQGMLPSDLGEPDIKLLRDSLLAMVNMTFTENGPMPALMEGDTITDLSSSETEACGLQSSSLSLTLATPRVMVWEGYREGYLCGAAHGNSATTYLNFSMTSGKIIPLNSLMKKGYEKSLVKLIRQKITESGTVLLVAKKDIQIPKQFAITSNGLLFSYDPYEIAPYSEGTVQAEIPTGDLIDILSPEGMYILTGRSAEEE